MKNLLKFRGVCASLALLFLSGTATAANLTVYQNNQDGWWYHIGTSNGVTLKFYVEENDNNLGGYTYRGILTHIEGNNVTASIEVPTTVTFTPFNDNSSTQTVTINSFGLDGVHSFSADNCKNVTLTIPDGYEELGDFSPNDFKKVLLNCSTPPDVRRMWIDDNSAFFVDNNYINTYRTYINTDQKGWGNQLVLPQNYMSTLITINANEGELWDKIDSQTSGNLDSVYALKVTGAIGNNDLNVIGNMPNIMYLDFSSTVFNTYEHAIMNCNDRKWLEEVKLPSNVKKIRENAFSRCNNLKSINLGNIEEIGSNAFLSCYGLTSVDVPNLKNIESGAFAYCLNLQSANLGNIDVIPSSCFSGCLNLINFKIPANIKLIDNDAFGNTALTTFDIPENVIVHENVFAGSKIKKLTYHNNSLTYTNAFNGMEFLSELYCYDPIPMQGYVELSSNPTLYVPAFSVNTYSSGEAQYNYELFRSIQPLSSSIGKIEVYEDLTISSTSGLNSGFDMILDDHRAFVNDSSQPLNMGSFTQYATYHPAENNGYEVLPYSTSSFISNSNVSVQKVDLYLDMMNATNWSSNTWNFISFPFTVELNKIEAPQEALFVIREYDAQERAANPSNGISKWNNVKTSTLEAGKGYILHFSSEKGDTFHFPAYSDSHIGDMFSNMDVTRKLNYYSSTYAFDESWNLIGNPYDCFYDIDYIIYGATAEVKTHVPITVWRNVNGNGFTYEAFSADDQFILRPFEAFFVQAIGPSQLDFLFKKEGRESNSHDFYNSGYMRSAAATRGFDPVEGTNRSIFNLYLEGVNGTDRTRLVVNPEASVDYEISCDASKLMSLDVEMPQIYMIEDKARMSINERPFGEGAYKIGVHFGQSGEYTISADSRNASEYRMILHDTYTGTNTDLNVNNYIFTANVDDSEGRFILYLNMMGSGVDSLEGIRPEISVENGVLYVKSEGDISVYSIDGRRVAHGYESINASLPEGIYVVKTSGNSSKVLVK